MSVANLQTYFSLDTHTSVPHHMDIFNARRPCVIWNIIFLNCGPPSYYVLFPPELSALLSWPIFLTGASPQTQWWAWPSCGGRTGRPAGRPWSPPRWVCWPGWPRSQGGTVPSRAGCWWRPSLNRKENNKFSVFHTILQVTLKCFKTGIKKISYF